MNKPIPEWLQTQEYLEARAAFIQRRYEEMTSPTDAHFTVLDITDNSKMLDQVLYAMEQCLLGHECCMEKTLQSCARELARLEFEENVE